MDESIPPEIRQRLQLAKKMVIKPNNCVYGRNTVVSKAFPVNG